ncbi:MAG: rhomboid family intramembrane serine protease [Bacteroidota bacterium]
MTLSYLLYAPVSLTILFLTLAVSIVALLKEDVRDRLILIPYDMLIYKEYWRLLTAGFIHGNYLHLTFNLTTFYFFAFMLEHRIGHWQFGVLYLAGMLISHLATTVAFRNDSSFEGSLGASGGISALVLAAAFANPYLKFGLPIISTTWPALQLPGYLIGIAYLLYSLVNVFRKSELRLNHQAHLWGAVSGILLIFLLKPNTWMVINRYVEAL